MKYLIVGASGFLGSTIYQKLKEKNEDVIGTYFTKKKDDAFVKVDLSEPESLIKLYETVNPDAVIWTVRNYQFEDRIAENVLAPFLKKIKPECKMVFLSTSVAYEKNMSEAVVPQMRTEEMYIPHYFNGKIIAEEMIKKHPNYTIIRPGSIYGRDAYGNYDERTMQLWNHVKKKEAYVRAKNICFSIVEVNELADAVIELTNSDFKGVINVSEETFVSHYEFNKDLCRMYGWDDFCIIGNFEEETIYYLDNSLRKKILHTKIGEIKHRRCDFAGN